MKESKYTRNPQSLAIHPGSHLTDCLQFSGGGEMFEWYNHTVTLASKVTPESLAAAAAAGESSDDDGSSSADESDESDDDY